MPLMTKLYSGGAGMPGGADIPRDYDEPETGAGRGPRVEEVD
jgi:hypothetical protein